MDTQQRNKIKLSKPVFNINVKLGNSVLKTLYHLYGETLYSKISSRINNRRGMVYHRFFHHLRNKFNKGE